MIQEFHWFVLQHPLLLLMSTTTFTVTYACLEKHGYVISDVMCKYVIHCMNFGQQLLHNNLRSIVDKPLAAWYKVATALSVERHDLHAMVSAPRLDHRHGISALLIVLARGSTQLSTEDLDLERISFEFHMSITATLWRRDRRESMACSSSNCVVLGILSCRM